MTASDIDDLKSRVEEREDTAAFLLGELQKWQKRYRDLWASIHGVGISQMPNGFSDEDHVETLAELEELWK